jgi:DnaA family protein
MKQLALGIGLEADLGFDDSIVGRNVELHHRLRQVLATEGGDRFVYLWGLPGSGRTHTLRACEIEAARLGLPAVRWRDGTDPGQVPAHALVLVDDVEQLSAEGQVALFHLFNRLRDAGQGAMVAAGGRPPAALDLRADLRTRLGSGLVYQLHPLSDEEKLEAIECHARARGVPMGRDVARYLLTRSDRDLRTLLATLDRLDRSSLERHRPLTIALLREVLRDR